MKKIILFTLLFSAFFIGTESHSDTAEHFLTVRETADAMKDVVSGVKLLVDGVSAPINEYGIDAVVETTTGGITRIIEGKEITFEIKKGSYTITSGIAQGKIFEYVSVIKEKSPTTDIKIIFYFNIESNNDCLIVSIPGYFSNIPPSYVKALEAYCSSSADGTKKMYVSIASDQNSVPRSNMRFLVTDNGSEVSVMALASHVNTNSALTGFYTLGFIADKDGTNNSTAFQGAVSSAEMSNNGNDFPGQGVSYNYGYFFNNNGTPGIPQYGVATESPEYPSFSSTGALYTYMTDNKDFFYNGSATDASLLSGMVIDIMTYPVQ